MASACNAHAGQRASTPASVRRPPPRAAAFEDAAIAAVCGHHGERCPRADHARVDSGRFAARRDRSRGTLRRSNRCRRGRIKRATSGASPSEIARRSIRRRPGTCAAIARRRPRLWIGRWRRRRRRLAMQVGDVDDVGIEEPECPRPRPRVPRRPARRVHRHPRSARAHVRGRRLCWMRAPFRPSTLSRFQRGEVAALASLSSASHAP